MAFEVEFIQWLHQSVSIEPYSGQSVEGSPKFGSSVSYSAMVLGKMAMIRDTQGQEKVGTVRVYLSSVTVDPRDRITLPSDFAPRQPIILNVVRHPDESGNHHLVILC